MLTRRRIYVFFLNVIIVCYFIRNSRSYNKIICTDSSGNKSVWPCLNFYKRISVEVVHSSSRKSEWEYIWIPCSSPCNPSRISNKKCHKIIWCRRITTYGISIPIPLLLEISKNCICEFCFSDRFSIIIYKITNSHFTGFIIIF